MSTKLNLKALYLCDPMGDQEDEMKTIQKNLEEDFGYSLEIAPVEFLEDAFEINFDVLFFDWGGMSIGNSMLEHFVEYLIDDAKEHPMRDYVMTSSFTKVAMEDALEALKREYEESPKNIFLTLEDWGKWIMKVKEPDHE